MTNYKSKICIRCGKIFIPTSNNQQFCEECRGKPFNKQWALQHPIKESPKYKKLLKQYKLAQTEREKQYINQFMKQWAKEHPEYKKQWKLDNPEKWKEMQKRAKFKREHNLGFVPLNEYFESADAHHIDTKHIIYMPKELHRSISHNVFTGKNMAEINAVAFNYLKDGESYQDVPTLSVAIHRIRPFQSMGN